MAPQDLSSARRSFLVKSLATIKHIHHEVKKQELVTNPIADTNLLSSLPIRESHMPFFADTIAPNFEPLFVKPVQEERFEEMMMCTWGGQPDWSKSFQFSPTKEDLSQGHFGMADLVLDGLQDFLILRRGDVDTLLHQSAWERSDMRFGPRRSSHLHGPHTQGGRPAVYPYWMGGATYDASGIGTPVKGQDCSNDLPHSYLTLNHAVSLDCGVLRSEIECVTTLMMERLRYIAWSRHQYLPVICYTFNGPKVRVTQAHFDGTYLQLLRTEPVTIIHPDGQTDLQVVNMLLRWMVGEPVPCGLWEDVEDNQTTDLNNPITSPARVAVEA